MAIVRLDHVNIITANLDALRRFYEDVLGLRTGDRPPFGVGGAWLYCGEIAIVHLVHVERQPNAGEPRLEHFAFFADGLADFLGHLRGHNVAYYVAVVPGLGVRQVNIFDPDGNHIEVQFAAEETADIAPFAGKIVESAPSV